MIVVLLLFIIPAQPKTLFSTPKSVESMEQEPENKRGALLNWKYTQEKLPWDLFLIMGLFLLSIDNSIQLFWRFFFVFFAQSGAGFAISDASKKSGLSHWLGNGLKTLKVLPPFALLLVNCIMTTALTEIASNSATANILLPILAEMVTNHDSFCYVVDIDSVLVVMQGKVIEISPLFLMVPAAATCSYGFMLPVSTPSNTIVFTAAKMSPLQMVTWKKFL